MLIASYETLRKFCKELQRCVDVLICDEGHRLKASGGSKTIDALLSLQCSKHILLTGTPVQNNLDEFYGAKASIYINFLSCMNCLLDIETLHDDYVC